MNKTPFADRVKGLISGLGLALLFGLSATGAQAQSPADLGMAAAPELITLANIDCQLSAAQFVADTAMNIDGKTVMAKTYEIACSNGPGWIIPKIENGGVESPYNCTQAHTYGLSIVDFIRCTLPQNQPHYAWMGEKVKPYAADCVLSGAKLIGSSSTEPRYDRYEYACQNGVAGGVIDLASPGSNAETVHRNCVMTLGTPAECAYTTAEQARNGLTPLVQKASATCEANNMRYVGRSTNNGHIYEVGCANEPGFVVVANEANDFDSVVACTAAAGIGGCQYTSVEEAASGQLNTYSAALKAQNITCTIDEFNIIGTQANTQRDYAELKCAEHPFGLIGFLPQEGSEAEANVSDCFIDQTRRKACTFVTPEQLTAHWDKLIKLSRPNANCDVTEVRYIGESEGVVDGVVAELACSNKRGYIAVLDTDRKSLVESIPCTIAKSRGEDQQCEIPGNGTYAAAE